MTTDQLIQSFYENKNLSKSIEMSKYMKNQFAFLGIPAPQRKALTRAYLKTLKKTSAIDWPLINLYWEKDFREFQYLAIDILSTLEHILGPNDLPYMKHFILMKSWWIPLMVSIILLEAFHYAILNSTISYSHGAKIPIYGYVELQSIISY